MAWDTVIFQYDGTFDGFLCCVFESYVHKEFPIAFFSDEECMLSLYPMRTVLTVPENARRVYRSIAKISPSAAEILRRCFLTCLDEKELHMYRFVRKLYQQGAVFLKNQADDVYHPIATALRHMNGELEKLRGFVRFSDYNGTLGAEIEPKNRVLPLLRSHFCNRYANESLFIYDRTHGDLLLYTKGRSQILKVDSWQRALPGEEEVYYRALWKKFYETIAIKERHNLRCQNTFLPKRYRHTMTEFLPLEHENPSAITENPKTPLPPFSVQ